MADRPAKLRRLNEFRRKLPHVSASALSAILDTVVAEGVPACHSRKDLRQAREMIMADDTPVGPIHHDLRLVDVNGEEMTIPVAHPLALLWKCLAASPAFNAFFYQRLTEKPSTIDDPWSIVLYTDEVTPRNPLAVSNKRKFQSVYWTFMEFLPNALCREEAWMTCVATQSHRINRAAAGLSQVVAAVLKLFFNTDAFNLQVGGMMLQLQGHGVRVWAKLGQVLQDGGAHKTTWHSRGDGADGQRQGGVRGDGAGAAALRRHHDGP